MTAITDLLYQQNKISTTNYFQLSNKDGWIFYFTEKGVKDVKTRKEKNTM